MQNMETDRQETGTQEIESKENFIRHFEEEIVKQIRPDETVNFFDYRKNNGIVRRACAIRRNGTNAAPTFYPEDYYGEFRKGSSLAEIAAAILKYVRGSDISRLSDMDLWGNYEKIRQGLSFRLIGYEKNRELLQEVPYERMEDMAIVFYYMLSDPAVSSGTVLIRNSHLTVWGITKETLCSDAFVNTQTILPPQIRTIEEILGTEDTGSGMYVLSNERNLFGAACVLYPGVLKKFAEETGGNLFILPSSVHEVILLPEKEGQDCAALRRMVCEINRSEVEAEDVLTDSIYRFDRSRPDTIQRLPEEE
jgi:hypothetical protein